MNLKIILFLFAWFNIQAAKQKLPEINIEESEIRKKLKPISLPVVLENIILEYLKSKFVLKKVIRVHVDAVNSLAILDDGRLASGSRDKLIIWNPKADCIFWLDDHYSLMCSALAVSQKGTLISGTYDGIIKVWPKPLGHSLSQGRHGNGIRAIVALENERFASCSSDKEIKIWDLKTNKVHILGTHINVEALVALPGDRLASGCGHGIIKIWDLATNQGYILGRHDFSSYALAALEDDKLVSVSHSNINRVKVWDLKTNKDYVLGLTCNYIISLGNEKLACCGYFPESFLTIWDLKNNKIIQEIDCGSSVWSLAKLANGDLVAGLRDGDILIFTQEFDILPEKKEMVFKDEILEKEMNIRIFKSLFLFAWFNIQAAAELNKINIKESELRAKFQPAGLPAVLENVILDYLKTNFVLKKTLKGHTNAVKALAVLEDNRLASGSWDHTIRIWQSPTKPIGQYGDLDKDKDFILGSNNGLVVDVAAIKGNKLASGGADQTIKIWPNLVKPEKGDAENSVLGVEGETIFALKYLPNDLLASGSNTLKIWDLKTGKDIKKDVFALEYLSDNKLVFASIEDFDLKILDISTGKIDYILPTKKRDYTSALAYLGGERLASAFHNGMTIKIWDLQNNTLLQTINCDGPVMSLATFANGDLAAGLENGDILIFKPEFYNVEEKKPWHSKLKFWKK